MVTMHVLLKNIDMKHLCSVLSALCCLPMLEKPIVIIMHAIYGIPKTKTLRNKIRE